MIKRIIAAALAAFTLVSSASFAIADEEKVEISFKVGDSILKINGAETEVETPYVAGEGVTLVPLRVITEAFGSQVDWDGDTKKITLTYPDVNIVLQIGNIVATVNDHSETLLEAPALSENGVTMVPLRFISETFGAEVGYDSDTQAILVTKSKIGDAPTVTGVTELSHIGDSYYGWSMDTPANMDMTDRRLDGRRTKFTADDGSTLYVDIYKYTKDTIIPFDEEYSDVKDSFSSYTLTEAEKLTDDGGHQYMYFQAKDKEQTVDYREFYGDGYKTYEITAFIKNDSDASVRDMILALADSFKLGNFPKETYDLSNVEGNMRVIKDDKYKFTMQIPADYVQYADTDTENEFEFYSPAEDSNARVALGIYSKTADVTAFSLAEHDRANRVKIMNPQFSTISEVTGTDGSYRYTHEISGSSKSDCYTTDTFFEKGDYVYNLAVTIDSKDDILTLGSSILSSLTTEELSTSEIGKLLRNDSDNDTMSKKTVGSFTFELPTSWKAVTSAQSTDATVYTGSFVDTRTASSIGVAVSEDSEYIQTKVSPIANKFIKYVKENAPKNAEFTDVELETIDGKRVAHFTYSTKSDTGYVTYDTIYLYPNEKKLVAFTLHERDIYFHKNGSETLINAVKSLAKK